MEEHGQITVRQALNDALREILTEDPTVFLMGEEVAEYQGAYKISQGLLEEFGEKRVVDTPITEYGFTGLGVGAAFAGLHPIIEFMSFNFSMQAIDHIINSAAKTRYMSGGKISSPIIFRGPNGAASRVAAQHSQCFASWYSHCPGLIVLAPFDAKTSKAMLKAAVKTKDPVIFLEHELTYGMKFDVTKNFNEPMQIGKALVTKDGKDATIVSFSWMMSKVNDAVKVLAEENNIDAEVIDLVSIRPLDIETIVTSVKKTGRIVIVEEGWGFAGIGSEICAQVCERAFDVLDCNPVRVFGEDVPMPYAKNLEAEALPTVAKICNAVKKACYI